MKNDINTCPRSEWNESARGLHFSIDWSTVGTSFVLSLPWYDEDESSSAQSGMTYEILQENQQLTGHQVQENGMIYSAQMGLQDGQLWAFNLSHSQSISFPASSTLRGEAPGTLTLQGIQKDPTGALFLFGSSTGTVLVGEDGEQTLSPEEDSTLLFASKYSPSGAWLGWIELASLPSSSCIPGSQQFSMTSSGLMISAYQTNDGVSVLMHGPCESCGTNQYCLVTENSGACTCLPGYITVGNQCYVETCHNQCNHGTCLYEEARCQCENGYLGPDCDQPILASSDDLFSMDILSIGTKQHHARMKRSWGFTLGGGMDM